LILLGIQGVGGNPKDLIHGTEKKTKITSPY
jgi:hypothetical protein